ncbi:hypothetical protein [Candidatus Korobacter versatilis]|nr:hypothetical protein [Candidatus Koribacter versatilis]
MRSTHFEEHSSESPVRVKLAKGSSAAASKRSKSDRKTSAKKH